MCAWTDLATESNDGGRSGRRIWLAHHKLLLGQIELHQGGNLAQLEGVGVRAALGVGEEPAVRERDKEKAPVVAKRNYQPAQLGGGEEGLWWEVLPPLHAAALLHQLDNVAPAHRRDRPGLDAVDQGLPPRVVLGLDVAEAGERRPRFLRQAREPRFGRRPWEAAAP